MPSTHAANAAHKHKRSPSAAARWLAATGKLLRWLIGLLIALAIAGALAGAMALAIVYPNLPDVSDLANYRPKLPLRIYTAEGTLIGEFGEERRSLTPIAEIPQVMKDAVLAIEDARFYQHGGIDFIGVARAILANFGRVKSQGASTITMQVARTVYLSSEKTYTRKIYEMLLTLKLEHQLSKDQILEIYMNQIFLGNHAFGFAAASETYFDKPLKDLSIAEAAMLAGIPKAPSRYNPFVNPSRARTRQLYIIERMLANDFITAQQAEQARKEPLQLRQRTNATPIHAEYVAEMVRQLVLDQYGADTYSRGLNVYTTITSDDQQAAYQALRRGILNYDRRQAYRGPEKFIDLPADPAALDDAIDEALQTYPDDGDDDLLAAVVLSADPKQVQLQRAGGARITIGGDGLRLAQAGLSSHAQPAQRIRPGAVVRIIQTEPGQWQITQMPQVQGALVALDPRNGAIRALVGGFDFGANKFNHVTQAWRQPGSSFKPFIYSAALEKGFSPATIIDDAPLFFDSSTTGGRPWEPKNFGNTYEGPMSMRRAVAKSKNVVLIRVLQSIGPKYAQDWIGRFGFDAEKHPPYLTMALGAGSVTPMQMASGYAVFANGGFRIDPFLVTRITDQSGKILVDSVPTPPTEASRAIDARNAFVMNSMLNEVTRSGTAAKAQAQLKRPDLYGKTGTTNDAMDVWFAGFQPTLVAAVWMGYDTPHNLGNRETGGGLSLPIWIDFMRAALKSTPVTKLTRPAGVAQVDGEWFYTEFMDGSGITNLDGAGTEESLFDIFGPLDGATGGGATPAPDERNRILDLFKN
ncbi:MAG: penicillin-binding protein 1A [Burkholderiaceae bacterium]|jgi:penicillin-binding protein 1A|nr:penicillin-binding protein 1A [Burkholderiaceae bacterium]